MEKKNEPQTPLTHEPKTFSRRQLLKCGAAVGAGLLVTSKLGIRTAKAQPVCGPTAPGPLATPLTPFVDRLPLPSVVRPVKRTADADYYQISIQASLQQLHRDLPAATPIWGYNGIFPGPTIEAQRYRKSVVTFTNNLPPTGYLPGMCPDPNVMGAEALKNVPYTVVHLHGADSKPEFDGFPYHRYPPGVSFTHEYYNDQLPATLWYHDHSMGVTRINVLSGLAAFYLIRDVTESELNLPNGRFEVPLVIQDRSFNPDGTLFQYFPWQPEFFGDYPLVNGKVWPKMPVTQGKYRFRILNGSNARFYNLSLTAALGTTPLTAPQIVQIGTDGGLLPVPVPIVAKSVTYPNGITITQNLLMAPAERADIIIDFSSLPAGAKVTLVNDAPAPFPGGGMPGIPNIMQFYVVKGRAWTDPIPRTLRYFPKYQEASAVQTRYLTLVDYGAAMPAPQNPPPMAPGYPTLLINDSRFNDPITEFPALGTYEIWNLINLAPDTHPIHLHQVQFQILDRQPFDINAYGQALAANGSNAAIPVEPYLLGTRIPPDPNEAGWKDTVRTNPGEVARIIAKFGPYRGEYVFHCHILDHEDNEMMRPFLVV